MSNKSRFESTIKDQEPLDDWELAGDEEAKGSTVDKVVAEKPVSTTKTIEPSPEVAKVVKTTSFSFKNFIG